MDNKGVNLSREVPIEIQNKGTKEFQRRVYTGIVSRERISGTSSSCKVEENGTGKSGGRDGGDGWVGGCVCGGVVCVCQKQ